MKTISATGFLLLASLAASCSTLNTKQPAQTAQPNIVIIFADDMGYGDMSSNGHPSLKTPNLDQMAIEGQKWTNFYVAASVCTPSRAGLMTGRLPIRSGMAGGVLFPTSKGGIPAHETTIAEALKQAGYKTGMVGKWHLGHLPQYLPVNNGFDSWYGIPYSNDMDKNLEKIKAADKQLPRLGSSTAGRPFWYAPQNEYFNVPLMEGEEILERAPNQSLLTQNYTKKAVEFIRANKNGPFFLYLAHNMPHVPLFASKDFDGKSNGGLYGDVIEELDWSVGQVLNTLKEQNIAENTLVIFTSDNGPWLKFEHLGGSAGPLRGGKSGTFEGGFREPTVMWWPGSIKPGVVHDIGSTLDILPTVAKIAGAKLPANLDGYDLGAVITDGDKSPRDHMFYYKGTEVYAVRLGRYKAHFKLSKEYGKDKIEKLTNPLLYDLYADPGEKRDVAALYPNVVKKIGALKAHHEAGVIKVENQVKKR